MTLRREVLLGGVLTILTASSEACCQPLLPPPRLRGCMIPDDLAARFFASSSDQQVFLTGDELMRGGSGDRDFDFALAQTLSKIGAALDVLPGFAYYDDRSSPAAFATPKTLLQRADGVKVDGTVLFGARLLRQTRVELESPEVAVAAVCAHEFGHILQMKYGLQDRRSGLYEALVKDEVTQRRVELHADFLAGYFAGIRKREKPDFPAAIFPVKLGSMGENDFNKLEHHGTPAERAAAAVQGFKVAYQERRGVLDAVRSGIQYVTSL
jgi:hypothetical protein